MIKERRSERRRVFQHPIEVEQEYAGRRFVATARDIGAAGMFIASPEPFVPGDFIRVRFVLPGTSSHIAIEAQVVRTEVTDPERGKEAGVGVRFLDAPEWVVAEVRRFVEEGSSSGRRRPSRR